MSSNNLIVGNLTATGTINNGSNTLATGEITSTILTNSGLITSGTIYAQSNFITIANGSSSHYFLTSGTSPTAGNFIGRLLGTSSRMFFDFNQFFEFRPTNTDGTIIGSSITFYNGGISSPSFSATSGSVSILNGTNSLATLYMNGFFIRKEATGGVGFVMDADNTYIWYSRASSSIIQLMTLDGGQLVVNVPINAGIKSLTCGAITSSGNFSNGANTLTTGNITTLSGSYLNLGNFGGDLASGYGRFAMGDIITFNYSNTGIRSSFQLTHFGIFYMNMPNGYDRFVINCNLTASGNITANGGFTSSDDRIKANESVITNATETLLKLRPEMYDKYENFELTETGNIPTGSFQRESGLIAQEVYLISELRHLVNVPKSATGDLSFTPSEDPNDDPLYKNWGPEKASLNYTGLIPFLIRGFQEQNETINNLKADMEELRKQISTQQTNQPL